MNLIKSKHLPLLFNLELVLILCEILIKIVYNVNVCFFCEINSTFIFHRYLQYSKITNCNIYLNYLKLYFEIFSWVLIDLNNT